MDQDIKKIKDEDKQEELAREADALTAGKLTEAEVAEVIGQPIMEETVEEVMPEEVAVEPKMVATVAAAPVAAKGGRASFGQSASAGGRGGARSGSASGRGGAGGHGGGKRRGGRGDKNDDGGEEFEQKIIDLARVTRVMAGGKRMRFRACLAIGDRKGRVGLGLAKGLDVTMAISKAVAKAKKDIVTVSFVNETLPFRLEQKYKAAQILFKPAKQGKGVVAGGAVRTILELVGCPNAAVKILGNNNKLTNAKAAMLAMKRYAQNMPPRLREQVTRRQAIGAAVKKEVKTEVVE